MEPKNRQITVVTPEMITLFMSACWKAASPKICAYSAPIALFGSTVGGVWTFDYEGISRANLAISYLTDAAVIAKVGMAPAVRDRLGISTTVARGVGNT